MPTELLTTKLFIPSLRPNLVPRPRLVQLLNEGLYTKRKLTLVSAPAGFGKTTLVVAWLKQIDRPAAWLSLDEADNDLPRFLAYLAATFQKVDEEIGALLRSALQSPQLPAVEKVLTGLLNEIAVRTDPLILVLDDYHLIKDAAVFEVMEFLLNHQPPQLHLVLTTREDPDLPLARLRARDQLNEIRARDLRFTQGEADILLRGVMGLALSEQDITALESRTEGWVVGLQLAGLSMQKQADLKSFIADFSGSHRHILDYLTDEVIQQQPDDIRAFLLQTAIIDRLSGPLCNALTGRNDSDRVLAHLEAANLFVIPLDEERRWYRYHRLFSDLLRSQLTRTQPDMLPGLHRRASRWYAENGDIQAAVDHALHDTDLTQAARLIEQHAIPLLYQGQVTRVVGWFDRLPEAVLRSAPLLGISKAWSLALMLRGMRGGEAELALQAAEQALDQVNAGEALRDQVAGHAATIRAYLLRSQGLKGEKPEKLIALSDKAQQLLPEQDRAIRSVNGLNIGYAYLALARIIEAVSGEPYETYVVDHLLTPLGMQSTHFKRVEADQRNAKPQFPAAQTDKLVADLNEYRGPGQEDFILQKGESFSTMDDYRILPPWGGLRGTPSDITHFLQMYLNDGRYHDMQILKPETVAAMRKMQKSTDGSSIGFGLGWEIGKDDFGDYYYHDGGGPGIETTLRYYPNLDLGVVVMANVGGYQSNHFADSLVSAWKYGK